MKYDNSLDALIKPGSSDHFFQFETFPHLYLNSHQFETSNACLLAELCRLIYRNDQSIYSGSEKISFLNTVLKSVNIEWLDCFQNDEHSVYAWLLKTSAYDIQKKQTVDCLILIFRGSNSIDNWKLNANAKLTSHHTQGNVHQGFLKAFESIKKLLDKSDDLHKLPIIVAGHSLGAALALLTMAEFQTHFSFDSCYSFGSPKIGDRSFIETLESNDIYRIINRNDIITMLPFDFLNSQYQHVGESHYFTEEKHFIGYLEDSIFSMQQDDLPNIKKINSIEGFLLMFKNLERDIPTYLSDHAPINYLVRLNKQFESLKN